MNASLNEKLGTVKWGEFKLGDLFEVVSYKKCFDANKVAIIENRGHPYIVRQSTENGRKGNIDEPIKYLNPGNTISFGQDTATMFYQEKPYFTGDKIKILRPKYAKFGKNNAQFFLSTMRKAFCSFAWGSSRFNVETLKKQKLLKVFNAELKLDIRGGIGTEKEVHSASREIITKTLHDAAFDIAYDSITPVCLTSNGQDQDDYGAYVELTRVFDVVDFDYLERIFSKGGLIEYLKKTEKEKIETTASVATESLNRSQQRSNSNAIRAKIKEAVAASGKQYDGIKEIIDMVRQIIPYNRMLISSDGYLIPLDDRYFRIDAQNLGFKYGGEITCVGMITNIIGEDTDPNDSQNIFATLQFSVNEVLRQLLPTKERNLCVIHPIAVYYGN